MAQVSLSNPTRSQSRGSTVARRGFELILFFSNDSKLLILRMFLTEFVYGEQ